MLRYIYTNLIVKTTQQWQKNQYFVGYPLFAITLAIRCGMESASVFTILGSPQCTKHAWCLFWSLQGWMNSFHTPSSSRLSINAQLDWGPGCFPANPTLVYRCPPATFYTLYTVPTVKHAPSVMVWGSFSAAGRSGLFFLPKGEKMNAQRYKQVLEDHLVNFMAIRGCTTFQHNSAPCHTAGVIKKWLADNDIQVLDWPGSSPDLNPIEHLWTIVKKKVCGKNSSSLEDLKKDIRHVWCTEVTPELCKSLADSMPRRIAKVIANKGYPTKYWFLSLLSCFYYHICINVTQRIIFLCIVCNRDKIHIIFLLFQTFPQHCSSNSRINEYTRCMLNVSLGKL